MRGVLTWLGWVLLSFGAALPGAATPPGDWYEGLTKPSWTPPGWVFPVVWTTLYVAMGTAAWLVQRRAREGRESRGPLAAFGLQLALNAAWTPVFFGAHRMLPALGILVALWLALLGTLLAFRRVSSTAAWLLAPYLVWVSVATVLNFEIWRLNS